MKKRITEAMLERMKIPAGMSRLDIRDTVANGLVVRKTKNKTSYCFAYRYGGKQKRITLKGGWPVVPLTEAREIVYGYSRMLARNIDPKAHIEEQLRLQMQEEERKMTVEELAEQFIEKYAKLHHKRWKHTEQVINKYICPAFGNNPACDLVERRKDIIRLLDTLKASPHPTTANHAKSVLSKMYSWAHERSVVEYNPCQGIRKPVKVSERERVLSQKEIKQFWHACNQLGYPYGPLCQLLLLTGQRRNEISTLQRRFIHFDEKVLRIPAKNIKVKHGQEVPLSDLAISILKGLPRFMGPYIFTTCFGEKAVNGFGKTKNKFAGRFDPDERWCYHDLRRTCATGMAQIGVPLHTISRVLNHAESGVTKIYARYSYFNEKREALNLWADHVWNIVSDGDSVDDNIVLLKDPLRQMGEPPTVINCHNGEVWYDKDGGCTFKPHRPESYLRHGTDVDYSPDAECPRFKVAMLQIFCESADPEEMYRHVIEIWAMLFKRRVSLLLSSCFKAMAVMVRPAS